MKRFFPHKTIALSFLGISLTQAASGITVTDAINMEQEERCYIKKITLDVWEDRDWLLAHGEDFKGLTYLNLSHQNIEDDFIQRFSDNYFERIKSIDLTGNPAITKKSLECILESDTLGSHRKKMKMDPRRGEPAVSIEVKIGGTSISSEDINDFKDKTKFNFKIFYKEPLDDISRSRSGFGLKTLRVTRERSVPIYGMGYGPGPVNWEYMAPIGPTGPFYFGATGPTGPVGPDYADGRSFYGMTGPAYGPSGPPGTAYSPYFTGPAYGPTGPAYSPYFTGPAYGSYGPAGPVVKPRRYY